MKVFEFLQKNISWNLHKNSFDNLVGASTSKEQLFFQLQRLTDRYFPERKKVETTFTEFNLNTIALAHAKTDAEKCIKHHFSAFWQSYLRVKSVFEKDFMYLPADGKKTRLEYVAELIAKCTQFAVDDSAITQICQRVREMFDLEDRELRNLENIVQLYKIKYFCAVSRAIFNDESSCAHFARTLNASPLNVPFTHNDILRHAYYSTKNLIANVDCLGNSATKFLVPTAINVKPYFYANGKNVFDTFCYSKFGKNTAEFCSQSATLKVGAQYFLEGNKEVRKFAVKNLGKGTKILTVDFLFRHENPSDKHTFFHANGALCMSIEGTENFYCALALVSNNEIVNCQFEEGRLSHKFALQPNCSCQFDVVTIFAENMPQLSDELTALNSFGATRCPYLLDSPSDKVINFKYPLNPSAHGYTGREMPPRDATTLNFTYQLGNDNVGTFLDNAGNCTTLLKGFAFGVGGEKVYSVKYGTIKQLNKDKFALNGDSILYAKADGTTCNVLHGEHKTYFVEYLTPSKTLFYFPLEEKCQISLKNNAFTIIGTLRKFKIECIGKVESYTTNSLECNTERLRYKLSNETTCGNCLAICFATALSVRLNVVSLSQIAKPQPLVRESLVSTYLNYVNNKNVFCLNNFLKRVDSLTLAAINFTNPQFIKEYVLNVFDKNVFYYDVSGQKKRFYDRLAMPLAVVYYKSMNDDESFPSEQLYHFINSVMFNENFSGRDLCVKALLLKKSAGIKGFNKVKCLIEYNTVKKIITTDAKLYGYAQAIGAVPMLHPSKERLKDLCNGYDIPKCWYYVSQLENLYGLSLVEGVLNFTPKVTQENVLEQLSINVAGKRIETSFAKSTVQSLTLNGVQYFFPFKPQNLKQENNTLVVRY